ncbi:hypothetical protein ABIA33_007500 [Streptacidiphilus sp. MAP12-16]|uniref:hypothetical protein n=1 Tax=Streptacidiphilus sp. MAP12-16 TaxID=3156300 RepID=UPI003512CE8F
MIVSLVYRTVLGLLSLPELLLRREASVEAELLVLRYENAVLRRQLTSPVRYQPGGPVLVLRPVLPDTPAPLGSRLPRYSGHRTGPAPQADRTQVGLQRTP